MLILIVGRIKIVNVNRTLSAFAGKRFLMVAGPQISGYHEKPFPFKRGGL
jgi:hypothetical protein